MLFFAPKQQYAAISVTSQNIDKQESTVTIIIPIIYIKL